MKKMSLAMKIGGGFTLIAGLALIIGLFGYYGAVKNGKAINEIGAVRLPAVDSLLAVKNGADNIRGTTRTLGIPGLSAEMRQRQYANLDSARNTYDVAWKTYETLPHSPEEEALWKQFVSAWDTLRAENNKYIEMCKKIDANGIADPAVLARQLEQFTKDHYILAQRVLHLLHMENAAFEGGDNHTTCNAGKWLPTFKTDNAQLASLLRAFEEPHRRFHEAVGKIKTLVAEGKRDEAQKLYQTEMVVNMQEVFKSFGDMSGVANDSLAIMTGAREQLLGPATEAQRAALEHLDKIVQLNRDVAKDTAQDANANASFLKTATLAAVVAVVILAVIVAFTITRSIMRPFQNIFKGLKTFSTAELNATGETFRRITNGLSEGVAQVNDAAGQVSSASQQLAEGASEQASSLEETSSALEQMAAMTRTNAANAKEANELAATAHTAAEQGDKTMTAINESSDQISKIIKVIEEIAFQTNLLALNAAVEAARAGEHGKGFAVVADEVRNLAQRAAQAAKETTGLIENSVNKSREGAEAIKAIVGGVAKVTDLINGIAKASDEQALGVEQVNTAVAQMDKVTQQNASGAEESASAAEELSAQAASTKGLVDELIVLVQGNQNSSGHLSHQEPSSRKRLPLKKSPLRKKSDSAECATSTVSAGRNKVTNEDFLELDDNKLSNF